MKRIYDYKIIKDNLMIKEVVPQYLFDSTDIYSVISELQEAKSKAESLGGVELVFENRIVYEYGSDYVKTYLEFYRKPTSEEIKAYDEMIAESKRIQEEKEKSEYLRLKSKFAK